MSFIAGEAGGSTAIFVSSQSTCPGWLVRSTLPKWNSSAHSARRLEVRMPDRLHVGIDARMNGNHFHGAAMTTMALASALCGSTTGGEQYSVLTSDRDAHWVRDACCGRARVLISNPAPLTSSRVSRVANAV